MKELVNSEIKDVSGGCQCYCEDAMYIGDAVTLLECAQACKARDDKIRNCS